MPELPEVEVLVRHLRPLLKGKTIQAVEVRRKRVLRPTSEPIFKATLRNARFLEVSRRGKYLIFTLRRPAERKVTLLIGHLGMTGRMYLQSTNQPWPKHAAVVLRLGRLSFVYEDARYFGRMTLDVSPLDGLGPEPFAAEFSAAYLARSLEGCRQPIKVKLLDQSLVAGVGNIYASEALFHARISPRLPAKELNGLQLQRLRQAVRQVLRNAMRFGSTVPLNWNGSGKWDGLFYYGRVEGVRDFYEEKLQVYDRAGQPCTRCRQPIQRTVLGSRSTFYCAKCQRA